MTKNSGQPETSDGVAGTKIPWPSMAYARACNAYSYRISELIFGSLLAAYILGFVAVGATLAQTGRSPFDVPWWILLTSPKLNFLIQALCVSLCFSYLTAAFYLTYHNSILTMPQVKESNLRWDFTIAILQAVFFGISVIRLEFFFMMLGLSLLIVFFRQKNVFKELNRLFWDQSTETAIHTLERKEKNTKMDRFTRAIRKIQSVEEYKDCLHGWLPVSGLRWIAAYVLFLGGLAIAPSFGPHSALPWYPLNIPLPYQSGLYVILTYAVYLQSSAVFLRSHEAAKSVEGTAHKVTIDRAAEMLVKKLRQSR